MRGSRNHMVMRVAVGSIRGENFRSINVDDVSTIRIGFVTKFKLFLIIVICQIFSTFLEVPLSTYLPNTFRSNSVPRAAGSVLILLSSSPSMMNKPATALSVT
jgi:hypothetical protein